MDDTFQAINPHGKPYQISHHHHHQVPHNADATQHPIGREVILPLAPREQITRDDLGQHEEHDQPSPDQEVERDVMPQRHEGEDGGVVDGGAESGGPGARTGASERDVDVADEPAVEAAVPGAPEARGAGRVGDAPDHVLGRVDAVDGRPQAEEAPWQEELQPEHVQVEIGEEAELGRGVVGPVRVAFGDCHAVVEVQDKFHGEEAEEEADSIFYCSRPFNGRRWVFELGDVVIKGYYWTC